MTTAQPAPELDDGEVKLSELGESLAKLRRMDGGGAVRTLRESLLRHGQFVPVIVYSPQKEPCGLEVIDGFKRLRAARALGWSAVRVRLLCCTDAEAKAAVSVLNQGQDLSALEEAWVVQALYREERLTQPEIGHLLSRDKSWVCRRLLLAEALEESLQVDVRLGLLSARIAETLARLPRVNQAQACERVLRHGLTFAQTERLVKTLLALPASEREVALDVELSGLPERDSESERGRTGRGSRPVRLPVQRISADLTTMIKVSGRLQGQLLATPLPTLSAGAAHLLRREITGVLPVLTALSRTLERALENKPHEEDMDPAR